MNLREIRRVASQIRKAVKHDCKEDDFIGNDRNLMGACGYASFWLHRAIPDSELVIGLFNTEDTGYSHCWVVHRNRIIDITATQFHIKKRVYIIDLSSEEARPYVPIVRGQKAINEIEEWYGSDYIKQGTIRS